MNVLRQTVRASAAPLAAAARTAARPAGARQMSAFPSLYNTFMSSNVRYVSLIVAGAVVAEVTYGAVTDTIWETLNQGKLFHHVDWSKFDEAEDDDDDDDE